MQSDGKVYRIAANPAKDCRFDSILTPAPETEGPRTNRGTERGNSPTKPLGRKPAGDCTVEFGRPGSESPSPTSESRRPRHGALTWAVSELRIRNT